MSEQVGAPKVDEPVVDKVGLQTDITLRFFERLDRFINGKLPYRIPTYSDLADIDARLPNPLKDSCVFVTGQGLAIFTGINWLLAADGITPIT